MRYMSKKKILAYVTVTAVMAGTVFGGAALGADYVYADENDQKNIRTQKKPDGIQVQMVDSVEELDDAMEKADMVEIEDLEDEAAVGEQADSYAVTAGDTRTNALSDRRYRLRRIILFADDVSEDYGASEVICYDKYDYYIFGFDTEQETQQAYEQMSADYGADKCMPDEVMYADDLLATGAKSDDQADIASAYSAVSWGCTYMGMDGLKAEVSSYTVEATVDVAVIDTGVNEKNALFSGRINEPASRNCYDSDNPGDYSDSLGHGSHVAGIIADSTPDNVQLTILKCFSDSGMTSGSVIQKGIMTALDQSVDVINMSFCFYGENAKEDTKVTIDGFIAAAKEQNIVMCVAAGNAGSNGAPMDVEGNSYPADREDVITVSALQRSSSDGSKVEFASGYSYYGEKVDFSAPGSSIRSAWKNGSYYTNSGTSMASPHIAAAAAYVKMVEPSLTNDELKNRLIEYSVDLGDTGKDIYYGYGCPYMADYFRDHANVKELELGGCSMVSIKNTQAGIDISWDLAENAIDYRIYRKSTGESYSCINTVTGSETSFVDTNVVSGKKYRYMVRPVRGDSVGKAENAMEVLRLAQPEAVALNGCNGMVVSWKRTVGATRYNVYRKIQGDTGWTFIKALPAGTYTFTDATVKNGVRYIYTVKAYGGGTFSSCNAAGSVMYRLATSRIISVGSPARRTVEVKWKKASEASGYVIQYSDTKTFAKYKNIAAAGNGTIYKKIIVKNPGATYYFRMRSYRNIGGKIYYGGWTATRKVKAGR